MFVPGAIGLYHRQKIVDGARAVAGAETRHREIEPRLHVLGIGGNFGFQLLQLGGVADVGGRGLQIERGFDALYIGRVLDLRRQFGNDVSRDVILIEGEITAQRAGQAFTCVGSCASTS